MPPALHHPQLVSAALRTSSQIHSHSHHAIPEPPPHALFCRPAEAVAPELIGCLLVKRQTGRERFWGVIVDTEPYCQGVAEGFCEAVPACHGFRRRTPSNETLFWRAWAIECLWELLHPQLCQYGETFFLKINHPEGMPPFCHRFRDLKPSANRR